MDSREYWKHREREQLKHNITEETEYRKCIGEIYDYMMDQIQREINGFYVKYAKKEGITLSEARKRVSKLDIEEYGRKAAKYVKEKDFSDVANEEMRLYNATMKINRLEMLKANIGLELVDGFNELQKYFDRVLTKRTLDEFERQAGILGNTVGNNEKAAHAIVNASFHNASFSDRIWMYQDMMKAELSKLLQVGLIQGKHPRVLARHLVKLFGVRRSDAERLMQTELARVQTEAQKRSFERNGYDRYEFIALETACKVCKAINGKHFRTEDMMPGENAPPMHPNCRCSTAAYMDREEFERWLSKKEENSNLELDVGEKIYEKVMGISRQKNDFKGGLEKITNKDVKMLLKQSLDRVTIRRASGRRSHYSVKDKTIYLAKNATSNTLAHELFHEIDVTYGLTKNGMLSEAVQSDYKRLTNLSRGYGKSIEEMLYSKYPDIFLRNGMKVCEEYRSVSDIINGMSGGNINMGFWHSKDYWMSSGKLEAETFAQIGRTLHESNEKVLKVVREIFPNSYDEIVGTLERMIK